MPTPPNKHVVKFVRGLIQSWDITSDGTNYGDSTNIVDVTNGVTMSWYQSGLSFQQNVFPTPYYDGCRDTWMYCDASTTNYNYDPKLYLNGFTFNAQRGVLLKFDLSTVPQDTSVSAVNMKFWFSQTWDVDNYFPIYEARHGWDNAVATWKDYTTGTSWGPGIDPGGAPAGGAQDTTNDIYPTILGYVHTPGRVDNILWPPNYATTVLNSDGLATVQKWINNPSSNYGFVIHKYGFWISNDTMTVVSSSKDATTAHRPMLSLIV
jgi:hypothetical protein